jgi:DNA-binding transcriptional LysR family regulator
VRLSQLEAFCRVVELGGFSAAATDLHVTQPAVSLHVRSLERELGLELITRGPRGVSLTEAGRVLYNRASRMLRERDAALAELARERGRPILLGASSTGVAYYLPPLLREFPHEVVTRVDITDRIVACVAGGVVDLGVVWGPVQAADVWVRQLGSDRFCVAAPAGDELCGRDVAAAELARRPFVLGVPGSVTRRWIETQLAQVGVVPRAAAEVSSTADMKAAVADGLGLAVVSRFACHEEFAAGRLAELRVPELDELLWRQVDLIQRRGGSPRADAAALGRFLAKRLSLPRGPGG